MPDINNFRLATQQSSAKERVLHNDQDQVVTTKKGISWFQSKSQKSQNKDTAKLFLSGIKQQYGEQIADNITPLISASLAKGKPLHARQVVQALKLADEIRPQIIKSNQSSIEGFFKEVGIGQATTRFDMKFDSLAKKYFGKDVPLEDIKSMVKVPELKAKVAQALDQMRMGGRNLVSNEEMMQVAENLIVAEFQVGHYSEQCKRKVNVHDANSLASKMLTQTLKQQASPMKFSQMTPAAQEQLQSVCNASVQKLLSENIKAIDAGGNAPSLTESMNDKSISRAVGSAIQKFVAERGVVYMDAIDALGESYKTRGHLLPPPQVQQLAKVAAHGTINSEQVLALGRHHEAMSLATTELSGLLANPVESREHYSQLGACLKNIHSMMAEVDSGNAHEQSSALKELWRFALADKTPQEINHLKSALTGADSKIPSLLNGLKYMEGNFSNYADCKNDSQAYSASQQKASECNTILRSLVEHLDENAMQGKDADFTTLEEASDATIALMRNIGLDVPAPNRIGSENTDVVFSDRAHQKIQKNVANLANIGVTPAISDGMFEEATRDFHRASYEIAGKTIARGGGIPAEVTTNEVKQALKDICTDDKGVLNEKLLLSVSKIAYQSLPACGLTSIYGMSNPDALLFRPGIATIPEKPVGYKIAQNDKGGIDVTVSSANIATVGVVPLEGDMEIIMLDQSQSYANLQMKASVGPNGEAPVLEDISYSYSLKPAED